MVYPLRLTGGIASASAVLLMLACSGASAQQPETPEQVARRYFDAMEKGDWKQGATLMHPDELARFRGVFVPLMESPKGEEAAVELFGLKNKGEFATLSDEQLFEQFLTKEMGESSDMAEMMSTMKTTVIGSVPEGNDTAHVLYRMKMNAYGIGVEELEVSTLKRYGNTWRMALDKNTEGMAELFKQMVDGDNVDEE